MIRLSLREIKKIRDSLPVPTREGERWHVPVPREPCYAAGETQALLDKMYPRLVFESVRWYGQYPYYMSRYRWVLITPIEIVV